MRPILTNLVYPCRLMRLGVMNNKQFPVGGVITSNLIGTAQDFPQDFLETVSSLQTEYKYPILKRVTYTRHLGAETQRGGGGGFNPTPYKTTTPTVRHFLLSGGCLY